MEMDASRRLATSQVVMKFDPLTGVIGWQVVDGLFDLTKMVDEVGHGSRISLADSGGNCLYEAGYPQGRGGDKPYNRGNRLAGGGWPKSD